MRFSVAVVVLYLIAAGANVDSASWPGGTSRSERGALKLLYWATEGPRWTRGWDIQNERSDPCLDQWYGVGCFSNGRIRSIHLPSNNLVGYVPIEFPRDALKYLEELDLSSNFLSSSVPATISRLVGLKVLRLDHNYFVGEVPVSLALLTQLQYLELERNQFSPAPNGAIVPDQVQQLAHAPVNPCHIIS